MSKITEEQIRQRAYELWQADGQPTGNHESHWEQASRELSGSLDEGERDSAVLPGVSSTKSAEPDARDKADSATQDQSAPLPGISKTDAAEPVTKKRGKSA